MNHSHSVAAPGGRVFRLIVIVFLVALFQPLLSEARTPVVEVLHQFELRPQHPMGPLLVTEQGNVFGTSPGGGQYGHGTIFQLAPDGGTTTLVSLNGANGSGPQGGLVLGDDGNFYGTAAAGGEFGHGTIFRVTPAGEVTLLASFDGDNGSAPQSRLVQAADGAWYGTTTAGGSAALGTVFRLTPPGNLEVVTSFTGANGPMAPAGLTKAPNGKLYGVTTWGGTNNQGTIFRIDADGVFTTIRSFAMAQGVNPPGGLLPSGDGDLYGTTSRGGGVDAYGTVYRLTASEQVENVATFTGYSLGNPVGALVEDSEGILSGIQLTGSASQRTARIFRLNAERPAGITGLSPETTYYFRVRAENANQFKPQRSDIHSFTTGAVPRLAYSEWVDQQQLTGEEADPMDDPHGLGIRNLISFALGMPAGVPRQGHLPRAEQGDEAGDQLALTFIRSRMASDVGYLLLAGDDLLTLQEVAFTLEVTELIGPDLERARIRPLDHQLFKEKGFLRLKILLVPQE